MLPEIALTVQIVRRLQRVFGDRIGIYHSGMSDNMRAELWRKQCSDEPFQLILGVRSSIFLPFRNLGLIIVDEEHDASAGEIVGSQSPVRVGDAFFRVFSTCAYRKIWVCTDEQPLWWNSDARNSFGRCGRIPA